MVSGTSLRLLSFTAVLFFFSCVDKSEDDTTGDTKVDTTTAATNTTNNNERADIKDHINSKADSATLLLSKERRAALSKDPQKRAQYRADIAEHLPKPKNWVNDYDDLFTEKQEDNMNRIISGFEKESGMQIAIITLDTFCVVQDNISAASLNIFNAWGIGTKEKNDGLLITIAKGYGFMRINTGSGTQQILNDQVADSIMRAAFFPSFAKWNFIRVVLPG